MVFTKIAGFFGLSKIKFTIIVMLIAALGTIGWLYRGEIREAARLMREVEEQRSVIKDLEKSVEVVRKEQERLLVLIDKHDAAIEEVQQESMEIEKEFKELEDENEEVKKWANTSVPNSVLDLLHEDGDSVSD